MKLKTILLGESGTGKSTLLSVIRDISTVIPTIGVDCTVHNNLQIWDTSGDERFRSVIKAFYSKMDLAVFMYRDMESLASVEEFEVPAELVCSDRHVPCEMQCESKS